MDKNYKSYKSYKDMDIARQNELLAKTRKTKYKNLIMGNLEAFVMKEADGWTDADADEVLGLLQMVEFEVQDIGLKDAISQTMKDFGKFMNKLGEELGDGFGD